MKILFRGVLAAACATALALPSAASAFPVDVRIEGETRTLLQTTTVELDPASTVPGAGCPGNTVAGAIEAATKGDWDRSSFVNTILGETHEFKRDDSWFSWVDGKLGDAICAQGLQSGDDVLLVGGFYDPVTFRATDLPLTVVDVPARVEPGAQFTVRVTEQQPDWDNGNYGTGSGEPVAAQGATVTLSTGASATTGADGRATLTAPASGDHTLQATRGTRPSRSVPVRLTVCCAPGEQPPAPQPSSGTTATATAPSASAPDRTAPTATVTGIRDGQVFGRRRGPRVLRGTAGELQVLGAQTAGVATVKLRLTRTVDGRCSAWSARRERLVRRSRCGASQGWWFTVGEGTSWEYQLPAALPRGRYVLDTNAIDRSFNRDDARRRGLNRVVFHVR